MNRHAHHDNPDPTPVEVHAHAAAARARKKAEAEEIGIDDDFIATFVEAFYQRIRGDGLLGPIFKERIDDWDWHLDRMKRFWRSILHNSGEFSGNPMAKHLAIPVSRLSAIIRARVATSRVALSLRSISRSVS